MPEHFRGGSLADWHPPANNVCGKWLPNGFQREKQKATRTSERHLRASEEVAVHLGDGVGRRMDE